MQFTKSLKLGILALLLVAITVLAGCGGGGGTAPPINHSPTIVSFTADPPSPIEVNQSTTITCYASDQDNDQLTYTWTKTGGTITGAGSAITWTAPAVAGTYTITCTISDGKLSATQDLIVTVEKTTPDWLGIPQIDPDTIFTEEATDVWLTILVNCKPEDLASESPVEIFIQNENAEWILLGEMFDDGDLNNHGDEIKGDRVYSNIIGFYEENSTFIPMKIVVTASDNEQYTIELNLNVVEDISEDYYQGNIEIFDLSEQKLNEIMEEPPADVETCLTILGDYLIEQNNIESYEVSEGTIKVTFDSGLFSTITLREEGSTIESGGSFSKNKNSSFVNSFKERTKERNILLQEQTTGKNVIIFEPNEENNYFVKSGEKEDVEYIGNRSVFIWDPFNTWHCDIGCENIESFSNIFNDSGQLFSIDTFPDHEADVDSLKEITDYGIVIFSTHGSGNDIATGEVPDGSGKYQEEEKAGEIWTHQDMVISVKEGIFTVTKWMEPRLIVSKSWFKNELSNDFPNSIIFNKSCKNGNQQFWEVFKDKGASTYYGNDNTSTASFGTRKVKETLQGLVEGKTTGEAYIEESETIWHWDKIFSFPYKTTNTWEMFFKDDKDNVKIPEFIPFSNGGFEDDFTNWEKEGDGRIIYALDFIEPTEGEKMSIISTGLGYTEKYGSLSQTFKVGDNDTKLRFDWNYLSEEFIEYIGSIYQDPFKVTLTKVDDSSTTTLLNKTVDSIAAEFGASHSNGGDLIYVSPDIVFDVGDVWMTGWQHSEYDISASQGSVVTIKFEVVDEGDTIYDTAILLDMINLE